MNKELESERKKIVARKNLASLLNNSKGFSKKHTFFVIRGIEYNVSEKSIKNWTPWMILGCLYYTMYIVHRSGGAVLNLVGTSKAINVIEGAKLLPYTHFFSKKFG